MVRGVFHTLFWEKMRTFNISRIAKYFFDHSWTKYNLESLVYLEKDEAGVREMDEGNITVRDTNQFEKLITH